MISLLKSLSFFNMCVALTCLGGPPSPVPKYATLPLETGVGMFGQELLRVETATSGQRRCLGYS